MLKLRVDIGFYMTLMLAPLLKSLSGCMSCGLTSILSRNSCGAVCIPLINVELQVADAAIKTSKDRSSTQMVFQKY